MKTRTTVLLLLVAIAVAAYVRFYERDRPNTAEAQRQAQNVVNFDRDKVDGITIQNGDDRVELRRQAAKWRLEAPIKDQADAGVINALLSDLDGWQKYDTISAKELDGDKNRLNEFGVGKAKLRLKLSGKDMPAEILIGKDAALEGKVYVRLDNSRDVFLAAKNVRDDIAKKPEEFRDKKLTDLTTAQISRAILKTPAGEMEVQRTGEQWEIVRPLRARADNQKVGDLLAQVTTARIEQFVADDHGDLHAYGLAEPRGAVTLFTADDKQGQTLQIGAAEEKTKEQVYVRFAARGAIYTLPKKIEELLNTKPADLRDRHLVRVDTNVLDRLTIEAPGKMKTVLARDGEKWKIANRNNQTANGSEVTRLLETLKNEQVTRFVADVASDLPKYGLDQPQLQVTFSSFASENTAESKAGEHAFATIKFGRVEGEELFARVGEEPFIVAVRRGLLDNIFADPLQWQELGVFNFKPEQIHRLSVTSDREITLVRGANNEWASVNASGLIAGPNVQSLLNTLSSLRAVRWTGAAIPAHAFDQPQITITFTTSSDDKQSHKLVIGGPAGNAMWFAKTDEHEGAFVLSNPDFQALRLRLDSGVPASPTPAAASPSPSGAATPKR
ncbi:MAG: DUF4340 domain-containing protein [Verrucomicrobiota bacterium]|nr:DUF4340 domain-containing protein [Verrucomicrobiota bacterium]